MPDKQLDINIELKAFQNDTSAEGEKETLKFIN